MATYTQLLFDYIPFIQVLSSNQIVTNLKQTISFTDTTDLTTIYQDLNDQLIFKQSVILVGGNRSIKLVDNLNFTQGVKKAYYFHLWDTINFYEPLAIVDNLVFTDSVVVVSGQFITDTITFKDTVTYNKSKVYHLTDTITFSSNGFAYVI